MIVSLPTPDGPEMMTSIAPGAPSTRSGRPGRRTRARRAIARRASGRSSGARRRRPVPRAAVTGAQPRGPPRARRAAAPPPGSAGHRSATSAGAARRGGTGARGPVRALAATSRCRRPGRPRPGGRSPRDGPGSGGSARSPGRARAASSRGTAPGPGSRSSTARPSGTTAIFVRCFGIAPDRRLDPADLGRHLAEDEGEVRLLDPARLELGHQRVLRGVVRATISSPLVSRSRRWTMPGRWTPAMPPNPAPPSRPRRALTSVPPLWPGDGWTTSPAALSMISRSASS